LSKLYVALTLSKEFTPTDGTATNPVTNMTVRGTTIAATFNASTDDLKVSTATAADVSPWHDASMYTDATATYECILLPQTVEAGTLCIRFYIDGKLYEWFSTAALTLEQGKQCTIALTVGRDRVEMGTITSKPWTVSNQGSLGTK
ncbi:MAG: fimbrillin family protein, partial [Oscillospiraceae bacterium]